MAWTAPRTWVVGEVVTAAQMNTHVRDNTRYLKGLDGAIYFNDRIHPDYDGHFYLDIAGGGNPIISVDSGDYMCYARASNFWELLIGNVQKLKLDANGATLPGWLKILSNVYAAGSKQGTRRIEVKSATQSVAQDTNTNISITWDNAFTTLLGCFITVGLFANYSPFVVAGYLQAQSTTGATARVRQATGASRSMTVYFLGIGT